MPIFKRLKKGAVDMAGAVSGALTPKKRKPSSGAANVLGGLSGGVVAAKKRRRKQLEDAAKY
jgi:hypothetical protein